MIAQLNKDNHVHRYKGYSFQKVITTNKRYPGGAYEWAFIMTVCPCGSKKPLEYGRRETMERMYMAIKRRFAK